MKAAGITWVELVEVQPKPSPVEGSCCGPMREREGLLHPFEIQEEDVNINRKLRRPRADRRKVVKQFSRPAAGRADTDPSHLRPAPVLNETVAYLLGSVASRDHSSWSVVYEFVFDRLRAVRQDMVMQGIVGRDAINILEQVVRFHLYASYRLRDAAIADFDPVINKQHLLECLKRLLYLYKICPGYHVHREEFEAVYLLDNLGDSHALRHSLDLSVELRTSPLVRQCYEISSAFAGCNYSRALRLISRLSSAMSLCAVNPHLNNLRVNYLQILSAGYSMRTCRYPLEKLRRELALTSVTSALDLCSRCELVDRFDHPDPSGDGYICFSRALFKRPQQEQACFQIFTGVEHWSPDYERPLTLAALNAILDRQSLSSLLMGQTNLSSTTDGREVNQVLRTDSKEIDQPLTVGSDMNQVFIADSDDTNKYLTGGGRDEMNKVLSRLCNVSLEETAKTVNIQPKDTSSNVIAAQLETSSSSRIGSRKTDSNSLRIEDHNDKPLGFGPSALVNSVTVGDDEGLGSNTSTMHLKSEVTFNQQTPIRRGRGRGVRIAQQDDSYLPSPGRGRGRGRRKV
ncbi:hypothetical protein EGW08_022004 [Elysia chlorotica]|uniref:SAC3/GANP/THP3 conserved domain-containing protein n=1 Tax=Elysia chlorotica TaxID=188477 RepID=A0A3S1B2E3_ELYCH|nr:hypothetical protein EGW08_022004 [Elysia chlorotica]